MASRHASRTGRRGVASWIIVTVVGAVLLAGAALAYFLIVRSDDEAKGTCTSQVQLQVVAAPEAAASITAAANAFNQTAPVARSACVTAVVEAMPDAQAQLATGRSMAAGGGTAAGDLGARVRRRFARPGVHQFGDDRRSRHQPHRHVSGGDRGAGCGCRQRGVRRIELAGSGRGDRTGRHGGIAVRPPSGARPARPEHQPGNQLRPPVGTREPFGRDRRRGGGGRERRRPRQHRRGRSEGAADHHRSGSEPVGRRHRRRVHRCSGGGQRPRGVHGHDARPDRHHPDRHTGRRHRVRRPAVGQLGESGDEGRRRTLPGLPPRSGRPGRVHRPWPAGCRCRFVRPS